MKEILSNIRSLIVPLSILAIIVLISFLGFKLFLDKVAEFNQNLSDAKNEQGVLNTKLQTLQTGSRIADLSQASSIALPANNSSFLILSQIKRKAGELGLTIENVRSGQEVKEEGNIFHVNISFEFEGLANTSFDLLDKLSKVAPINRLTRLKLSGTSGAPRISIDLNSYWSTFPVQLPEITAPVTELTSDENEVLTKISALEAPIFAGGVSATTTLNPSSPVDRPNPFGL